MRQLQIRPRAGRNSYAPGHVTAGSPPRLCPTGEIARAFFRGIPGATRMPGGGAGKSLEV